MSKAILESTLTCPRCGKSTQETMPTNVCEVFFECPHCKSLLHPLPGDCCVFCSYGSIKCHSKQGHDCHCQP